MCDNQESPSNRKQFHPCFEVEHLAKEFSRHFHHGSLTPDFYINNIHGRAQTTWDMYPSEEPVKKVKDFILNSHLPTRMKKRIYFKAERAKQHLIVSEILAHYFFTHLEQIHYRRTPISQIGIQWVTITGHKNPYDEETEEHLLLDKQPISLIYLKTESGQVLYLDLCSPQVDVHSYTEDGFPYLILEELKLKKQYAPKFSNFVTIDQLSPEPELITDEAHFGNYLEMIVDQAEKEEDDDRAEYLVEYHERLENDFDLEIQKQMSEN